MIPKTIVKIPKNIFFTPKIPILMKFLVLVVTKRCYLGTNLVTKRGYLGTNLVTKRRYPEQTLSPNGVTRNKPCHQTASPGTNLVTKRCHLGTNLVTKRRHLGTNPVTKAKNLRVVQDMSGQVRAGQGRSGQVGTVQDR